LQSETVPGDDVLLPPQKITVQLPESSSTLGCYCLDFTISLRSTEFHGQRHPPCYGAEFGSHAYRGLWHVLIVADQWAFGRFPGPPKAGPQRLSVVCRFSLTFLPCCRYCTAKGRALLHQLQPSSAAAPPGDQMSWRPRNLGPSCIQTAGFRPLAHVRRQTLFLSALQDYGFHRLDCNTLPKGM
jgi:hypothetical protein